MVHFDGLASVIVHNAVNALTGDYLESGRDIILAGSEPLIFERKYCSSDKQQGNIGFGWNHNQGGTLSKQMSQKHCHSVTKGGTGECVYRGRAENKMHALRIHSGMLKRGVTNCTSGILSSRTNMKNHVLDFEPGSSGAIMDMGSGWFDYYKKADEKDSVEYFSLFGRKQTNFHYRYFNYNSSILGSLESACVRNREKVTTNKLIFSQVTGDDVKKAFKKNRLIEQKVYSENGQWANYTFKVFSGWRGHQRKVPKLRRRLIKVDSSNHPTVEYDYEEHTKDYLERIVRKRLPDGRYLEIEYDKTKDKFQKRKVKSLFAPGVNSERVMIYEFVYSKNHGIGTTSVYDANRNLTRYEYTLDPYQLKKVIKFKDSENPFSTEEFSWGDGRDEGNLKGHRIKDQNGDVRCRREYHYDSAGNVTKDCLMGNLRGVCEDPIKSGSHKDQKIDRLVKKSKYITEEDGMNLLLESTIGGETTIYEYHDGADLIKSKYLIVDGQMVRREFFYYDENAALTIHIIDDGKAKAEEGPQDYTGVTERKITYFQNRMEAPFGLPRVISEYVWKNGKETLLGKKENHHNSLGQIFRQDVYDNENRHVYSLHWEYDRFGNVKLESNAVGEITTREYDENCNLIVERGPNKNYYKKFAYDKRDRLTESTIVNSDGSQLTTRYGYDNVGNKTSEIDISGNTTVYEYDGLNQLVKVTAPPVIDENNQIYYPQTFYEYDLFGHVSAVTDPRKLRTEIRNTITGKPYRKDYPDGTTERFEYSLKGEMVLEVKADGSSISYKYDYDSRPYLIEYFDSQRQLVKTVHKKYDAFHLIQEIEDGVVTDYEYNSAGRLSVIKKNGKIVTVLIFDPLGREVEKYEGTVRSFKDYDLLNRVIREGEKDLSGHQIISQVSYSYDGDGNRISVKEETQGGVGETIYHYNSLRQVVARIDPYKQKTTTTYHYDWLNEYGVRVVYSEEKDPLGRQTVMTRDSNGRIEWIKKGNKEGLTIQQAQLRYDRSGNKARHIERVITPEKPDKLTMHAWIYDSCNRLIEMAECVGEENVKVTYYAYDLNGNRTKVVQPNGISLESSYNSLNQLVQRKSSDGTISETYFYNSRNLLEKISDLRGETHLSYDEYNHLKEERLANGLKIRYERDITGRVAKLFYPDDSFIALAYESSQLRRVSRHDPLGHELYISSYEYDPAGNLIQTKLPGALGSLRITYDLMSRPLLLETPHWKEEILSYDPVGNITGIVVEDKLRKYRCDYAYDDLSQLTIENEQRYAYDSTYNLICKDNQPHLYNEQNQLLYDGEVHYAYDPNGNLISDQSNIYHYDALNRLIKVETGKETVDYLYDPLNRRLAKKKDGAEIRFLYIGQNEVGSVDEQNRILELKILGSGSVDDVGSACAIELQGQVYIPLHDHRGNIAILLDKDSGAPFESYRYSAFGEEEEQPALNPWRFSSKRVDPETGFVYFGERYYSPKIRRWITRDPLNFEGGINFYAYVENNPLAYCDPTGCFSLPTFEINSNFIHGGIQAFGGLSEAVCGAGMAMATAPTGVGPVLGGVVFTHGMDSFFTGVRQMFSSEPIDTATTQLLQKTGMSHSMASSIDNAIGMIASPGKATVSTVAKAAPSLVSKTVRVAKAAEKQLLKPTNKRNFRENLSRLTNQRPGSNYDAHHVFPKKFKKEFAEFGINIHDPKYGAWWKVSSHRTNAYDYNRFWELCINDLKSKSEILEKGRQAMNKYNIQTNF